MRACGVECMSHHHRVIIAICDNAKTKSCSFPLRVVPSMSFALRLFAKSHNRVYA